MDTLTGPFKRLLIANRGEIAVRLARAARAEGITPLGVYSEADRHAAFLDVMEDSALIGAAPATESYLHAEHILAAAGTLRAQAIHPGYGFLSERPAFAQAVIDAGYLFVGPSPAAMLALGDKSEAKRHARACGIPVIPGYDGEGQSAALLREQAERIGTPLLIKASAGGGGRGMRMVEDLAAFDEALDAAKREALAGFGDDRMLLERYLINPRHIEFQLLADAHGNVIHVGERDCSVQRRRQKLLEEAPSPALTPQSRALMGEAAVHLARAANYVNAGTVEFLMDESGAFFFLEMNARLQVEHPVTEEAYDIDLPRMQLRIARGERLTIKQEEILPRVWAVEARINAEEPSYEAFPSGGTITAWTPPEMPGIRLDSGVRRGSEVTTDYDGLLAKLIATGPDRLAAIGRLTTALETLRVSGVTTNIPLLAAIARDPVFRAGEAGVMFFDERKEELAAAMRERQTDALWLAIGGLLIEGRSWRVAGIGIPIALQTPQGVAMRVLASRQGDAWQLSGDVTGAALFRREGEHIVVERQTSRIQGEVTITAPSVDVIFDGGHVSFTHLTADAQGTNVASDAASIGGEIVAPMPGKIAKIAVGIGDTVREHDLLLTLEAMKMEHRLEAPFAGTVSAIHVASGALVTKGASLLEIVG